MLKRQAGVTDAQQATSLTNSVSIQNPSVLNRFQYMPCYHMESEYILII